MVFSVQCAYSCILGAFNPTCGATRPARAVPLTGEQWAAQSSHVPYIFTYSLCRYVCMYTNSRYQGFSCTPSARVGTARNPPPKFQTPISPKKNGFRNKPAIAPMELCSMVRSLNLFVVALPVTWPGQNWSNAVAKYANPHNLQTRPAMMGPYHSMWQFQRPYTCHSSDGYLAKDVHRLTGRLLPQRVARSCL